MINIPINSILTNKQESANILHELVLIPLMPGLWRLCSTNWFLIATRSKILKKEKKKIFVADRCFTLSSEPETKFDSRYLSPENFKMGKNTKRTKIRMLNSSMQEISA